MLETLKDRKWIITISFVVLGLIGGYMYWNFYGCTNGCTITGVWYNSTLYGGLLGYLLSGAITEQLFKNKEEDELKSN